MREPGEGSAGGAGRATPDHPVPISRLFTLKENVPGQGPGTQKASRG